MKKIAFYFLYFISIFFILELGVYYTGFDIEMMRPLFYWVEGDYQYANGDEIYESFPDPQVLYAPKKSSQVVCEKYCLHPKELASIKEVKFQTNEHRSRVNPFFKGDKSIKIYWSGGSFSWGVSSLAENTIQAQLQKHFNQRNLDISLHDFSANAYVLSQKISRLERAIKKSGLPQFIFIQNTNGGRRAFFYKEQNFRYYFEANNELYEENYPNYYKFFAHQQLVSLSSLYRLGIATTYRYIYDRDFKQCQDESWRCWQKVFHYQFDRTANEYGEKSLERFVSHYGNKTQIILFNPLSRTTCDNNQEYIVSKRKGYRELLFCDPRPKGDEYNSEIHPPSYVYKWYGDLFKGAIDNLLRLSHLI